MERCPYHNNCGLIKFLAKKTNIKPEEVISCGKKDPLRCGRVPENPLRWVPMGIVDAVTHEEMSIIYPKEVKKIQRV